jgi:hypothetical protein
MFYVNLVRDIVEDIAEEDEGDSGIVEDELANVLQLLSLSFDVANHITQDVGCLAELGLIGIDPWRLQGRDIEA